ncbi:hypothetical protein PAGU2638_19430 [Lysobacter sp. PAGU 2638]
MTASFSPAPVASPVLIAHSRASSAISTTFGFAPGASEARRDARDIDGAAGAGVLIGASGADDCRTGAVVVGFGSAGDRAGNRQQAMAEAKAREVRIH